MYKIDIPTYHWDNDRFEIEIKVRHFDDLIDAGRFQKWLRSLRYENDSLLCHRSVRRALRDGRTHEIPHENSRQRRAKEYDKVDVYNGVIIEASFDIYTEEVIRTKIAP